MGVHACYRRMASTRTTIEGARALRTLCGGHCEQYSINE